MDKSRDTEVRKIDGYKFVINWYYDYDGDTDWLGEFCNDDNSEWIVDRRNGVLLGEWQRGDCIHCGDECDTQVLGKWLCVYCYDHVYMPVGNADLDEIGRKEYDTLCSSHYARGYEFWKPSDNHCPPEQGDVRPYQQWQQAWCDRLGVNSITEANIQCILEDHRIIEDLCKGNIWFEGYVVTMYKNGIELDDSSCWGFLDVDEAYREETISDVINSMLRHAKELEQKKIAELQAEINNLESESEGEQ